jgi:hypothetical protein
MIVRKGRPKRSVRKIRPMGHFIHHEFHLKPSGIQPASPVTSKINPDANKDEVLSCSAHHTTEGRPVHRYQPDAHLQEILPVFNKNFFVIHRYTFINELSPIIK